MSFCQEDGRGFEFTSQRLRNDKELAMVACQTFGWALEYASEQLQDDEDVVNIACKCNGREYLYQLGLVDAEFSNPIQFASERLRNDKNTVLFACRHESGRSIQYASEKLRGDKDFVVMVCRNISGGGGLLEHVSKELQNDRDVVVLACQNEWSDLYYASDSMRNDKYVILSACKHEGNAFLFASEQLKSDKKFVIQVCEIAGGCSPLLYASQELRKDMEFVREACQKNGKSLEGASSELQDDNYTALIACKTDGNSLQYASERLRNDKEVVMTACQNNGWALQYASETLREDKDVVIAACENTGRCDGIEVKATRWLKRSYNSPMWYASSALQLDNNVIRAAGDLRFASTELRADRDFALKACSKNGMNLQYASEQLRSDKEVVLTATKEDPLSLKFALDGLNQDRDCLLASKLWVNDYSDISDTTGPTENKLACKKIVLSTRFSLGETSDVNATQFTLKLLEDPYIRDGNFVVYSPNAYAKSTCDPEWTRMEWPCRGTFETCKKQDPLVKTGVPQPTSCWRYSFRGQLENAKHSQGFMIQIVDFIPDRHEGGILKNGKHILGNGQQIETVMANDVGTKIFRVYQPISEALGDLKTVGTFSSFQIRSLVSRFKTWYDLDCQDMTVEEIRHDS